MIICKPCKWICFFLPVLFHRGHTKSIFGFDITQYYGKRAVRYKQPAKNFFVRNWNWNENIEFGMCVYHWIHSPKRLSRSFFPVKWYRYLFWHCQRNLFRTEVIHNFWRRNTHLKLRLSNWIVQTKSIACIFNFIITTFWRLVYLGISFQKAEFHIEIISNSRILFTNIWREIFSWIR